MCKYAFVKAITCIMYNATSFVGLLFGIRQCYLMRFSVSFVEGLIF